MLFLVLRPTSTVGPEVPNNVEEYPDASFLQLEAYERLMYGFVAVRWNPAEADFWANAAGGLSWGERTRQSSGFQVMKVRVFCAVEGC